MSGYIDSSVVDIFNPFALFAHVRAGHALLTEIRIDEKPLKLGVGNRKLHLLI